MLFFFAVGVRILSIDFRLEFLGDFPSPLFLRRRFGFSTFGDLMSLPLDRFFLGDFISSLRPSAKSALFFRALGD